MYYSSNYTTIMVGLQLKDKILGVNTAQTIVRYDNYADYSIFVAEVRPNDKLLIRNDGAPQYPDYYRLYALYNGDALVSHVRFCDVSSTEVQLVVPQNVTKIKVSYRTSNRVANLLKVHTCDERLVSSENIAFYNTVHVASTGSDVTGEGTVQNPLKTIKYARTERGCERIMLRRSDTFHEFIISDNKTDQEALTSNLHIGAYGIGVKPTVSGYIVPTQGTEIAPNRYRYTLDDLHNSGCPSEGINGFYAIGHVHLLRDNKIYGKFSNSLTANTFGIMLNANSIVIQFTNQVPYQPVEFAPKVKFLNNGENIKLEGIKITGYGIHGVQMNSSIDISYCIFDGIGGCIQKQTATETVRYGNGVELYINKDVDRNNVSIHHCLFKNIYDTAVTIQTFEGYSSPVIVDGQVFDFLFEHNYIENCYWGCEFEAITNKSQTPYHNCVVTNNIIAYDHYGFVDLESTRTKPAFICSFQIDYDRQVTIKNNLFIGDILVYYGNPQGLNSISSNCFVRSTENKILEYQNSSSQNLNTYRNLSGDYSSVCSLETASCIFAHQIISENQFLTSIMQ